MTDVRQPNARTVLVLALAAMLVVAAGVAVQAFLSTRSESATSECTVPVPKENLAAGTSSSSSAADPAAPVPVYLSAVQLQHASTINAVGMSRGLPQRARVIALATAFQESKLRNLPGGDRDSLGLFQQRPSQGWGSAAQISDPVYAAGKFYTALGAVDGWQQMSLTKAAQAVQRSGFPEAYAKWESQAATLAAILGGSRPLQLSCAADASVPSGSAPVRKALPGTAGAPPALAALLSSAQAELGGLAVVGVTGRQAVVTVAVPGVSAARAGRALAAWAVAHSNAFTVATVSVDDQRWIDHGWRAATSTTPPGQVGITIA